MQSSSAAKAVCIAAVLSFTLVYFPILLTPAALAQSVALPSPVVTSVSNIAPITVATSASAATSAVKTSAVQTKAIATPAISVATTYPRLIIPAINLNDPIVDVGVDSTGAMAVPNGKTSQVGWYDGGVMPGDVGSAVLDAHVFAAFTKLNELKAGDDIYVETSATTTLHFVVTATKAFALADMTSQDLFVPTTDRDLNLITCAGQLTPDHSTYDHRIVVYSTFVK